MGFIEAFRLCRSLESRGLASLCFPASNFIPVPEIEGRQDVQQAIARYCQLHHIALMAINGLKLLATISVAVLASNLLGA